MRTGFFNRLVASIEAYDIENDKWTLLRPMTHPRMGMACAVIDDHIWCMGGVGLSEDSGNMTYPILSSVLSYDIGKDAYVFFFFKKKLNSNIIF